MGIMNPLLCHYHLDTFTLVKVWTAVTGEKEEPARQKLIVTQSQLAHPMVATQLSFSLFFKSQNPFWNRHKVSGRHQPCSQVSRPKGLISKSSWNRSCCHQVTHCLFWSFIAIYPQNCSAPPRPPSCESGSQSSRRCWDGSQDEKPREARLWWIRISFKFFTLNQTNLVWWSSFWNAPCSFWESRCASFK